MLQEQYRELLTAYVDGELSARQRRHALRLLRRSPEARQLLQRLQTDSRELRNLPRPRLDRDLSGAVLQKIAVGNRPIPIRQRRRVPVRTYPSWVGAAAAAAVLLAVGTASYAVFSLLGRPSVPVSVAVIHNSGSASNADEHGPGRIDHSVAQTPAGDPDHEIKPEPRYPNTDVAHEKPIDPTPAPLTEKDEPVLTSQSMEVFDFKTVVPSLDVPTTFKLRDLEQDAAYKKLLAELPKDAPLHLELPCPDGTRAFERLQSVLKAHHIDLAIDATAQRRLGITKAKTNYVLYSEDLTADELAQLLKQLGSEDKKEKNPFDALVVRRMTEGDHKELSKLLGVDPVQTQPSKEMGPLGVDPHKPLSDQTAAQLAAALAGQGKPGAKQSTEHVMLAMPYNPVQPKRDSTEIKRFLEERKPLRTGALQVLLVLRGPTS